MGWFRGRRGGEKCNFIITSENIITVFKQLKEDMNTMQKNKIKEAIVKEESQYKT